MKLPQAVVPMIHVPDVRATVEWYRSIGFAVAGTHEDAGVMTWAAVTFGGSVVMFSAGGAPSAAARREVDLYITVDDVDAAFARVSPHAELVEGLHDTEYGMREFIVRDGNRFWMTFGQPLTPSNGQ